jgi:hypothetical protein
MKYLFLTSFLFSFSLMSSESDLPKCPKKFNNLWHNCQGTYIASDGAVYKGEFFHAMMNGEGTKEIDGVFYEGTFLNWRFDGIGTYRYANGAVYTGEFLRGFMHGKGLIKYQDNTGSYEGDFVVSQKFGQGRYEWPDSSFYEGSFKFDKKDGQGSYVFANGAEYTGSWENDQQSGFGKETSASFTYEGQWNLGKMWGNGTYTSNDGSYYQGQFLNGYLHGKGTCYSPGNEIGPCEFKDGKNISKSNSFFGNFLGNLIKQAIIGEIIN